MRKRAKENNKTLVASAFEVLLEGIGPRRTAQFWHAFMTPKGDYVQERKKIFGRKSVSALAKEARKYNKKK